MIKGTIYFSLKVLKHDSDLNKHFFKKKVDSLSAVMEQHKALKDINEQEENKDFL